MKTSTCFLCESNKEIIGMAFLVSKGHPTSIFKSEWSYLRMVGVKPKFGGHGIAKKLTQMCIDLAKETNEQYIALHTSEFMDAARHIYENFGFKQIRELDLQYGKRYWIYLMDLSE
jgi:ribosomal protein S18 acetylase RimI-like enzyme